MNMKKYYEKRRDLGFYLKNPSKIPQSLDLGFISLDR